MSWKIEQHKRGNGQQEIQVAIIVKEMKDHWSTNSESWISNFKDRLKEVEKIIMPFLTNLYKTASQPYIHWPNRGPIIEKQMQKILTLTRG